MRIDFPGVFDHLPYDNVLYRYKHLAVVISLIPLIGMYVSARSYITLVRKVVLEGCKESS